MELLQQPLILIFCGVTFFIAGAVKGVLGIGLPTTAMALLTLVMAPTEAISVLALPIILTNIQQFFSAPNPRQTAMTYRWVAVPLVVMIFLTALSITQFPESFLITAIGVVMCLFSVHALFGFSLPIGPGRGAQLSVGIAAGICGGLSAIWAPPVVMYLIARRVGKDEFVAATGFLFLVGSIPLAAGLVFSGVLDSDTLGLSLACAVVTVLSFRLGAKYRSSLGNETFRKVVLVAFLIMGARLIYTGLLGH